MIHAAAIIRFSYPATVDPAEWRWRFERFRRVTLPALRAQTVPLDVWVWVDERHRDEVAALDVHTFSVDEPPYEKRRYIFSSFPWSAVHGLPKYALQLSLGSDDVVAPTFLAAAELALEGKATPAIATPQPWKYDVKRHRAYRMGYRYHEGKPSPFLVIKQPVESMPFLWPWAAGHMSIAPLAASVTVMPEGYAALAVHGWNDSTTITPQERPLGASFPSWVR